MKIIRKLRSLLATGVALVGFGLLLLSESIDGRESYFLWDKSDDTRA